MALIDCPECSKQVSESAASCPHCGHLIGKVQPQYKGPLVDSMKKCPQCAEELTDEAVKCLHCGYFLGPAKTKAKESNLNAVAVGCGIGCIAIPLLMFGFCSYLAVQTPSSSPTPSVQSRPRSGNDVILRYANSNTSGYLAVDDDAWDAMFEAINAKDTVGLMRLVGAGRVHVITAGTRAKVLDSGFVSYKVRLMSGPSSGVSGWVPMEFVQR